MSKLYKEENEQGNAFPIRSLVRLVKTQISMRIRSVWPRGYKTFFMLNSAKHEFFSTNKYENANNSWHFHIY